MGDGGACRKTLIKEGGGREAGGGGCGEEGEKRRKREGGKEETKMGETKLGKKGHVVWGEEEQKS